MPVVPPWLRLRWLARVVAVALALPMGAAAQALAPQKPMLVEVDLTDAPRRMFHTHLVLPATPGTMTLVYPKWIPGEHMPSGPVVDVAGLVFRAAGAIVPWRRDDVDMFSIRVEVPAGAPELDVTFDLLSPPPGVDGYSSGASATANIALLSWNQVVFYAAGVEPQNVPVQASLKLPAGWGFSSALTPVSAARGQISPITFAPVSLARLVDSPVLTGAHLREVPLGTLDGAAHFFAVAGETEGDTELSPSRRRSS